MRIHSKTYSKPFISLPVAKKFLSFQNVIVRQSSQLNSRALSGRLPPDKGPYIQHYLIEIHNEGSSYSLQASENRFDTLPSLITYYSQCCEELLAQLKLPRTIQEAKTRHELGSLSLLGQGIRGNNEGSDDIAWLASVVVMVGHKTKSRRR
ncbi:protein sprint-like isoform X1 [Scylla paramamosain]|uniref:protein sprint-like isoform X1 n=1 Tax=Scylla paramamosain TaxID=85552 RepID=UPI0030833841